MADIVPSGHIHRERAATAIASLLSRCKAVVSDAELEALKNAGRRGDTTAGEVGAFLAQLEELPIRVDPMSSAKAFSRTLGLARSYALSAHDAAYLELAIRE